MQAVLHFEELPVFCTQLLLSHAIHAYDKPQKGKPMKCLFKSPLYLSLLFSFYQLIAVEAQFSTHFQRRFGLNSPIYNGPLYFSSKRMTKKCPLKKRNYRDRIKKKLQKTRYRKRSTNQVV